MSAHLIIALDGPAGSGKSTLAQRLAQKLGAEYIDSGAIYRSLAFYGQSRLGGVEGQEDQIAAHFRAQPGDLGISYQNHTQMMRLQGRVINEEIRSREITALVRFVANHAGCREIANARMREAASRYDVVVDGRDIGSVVFPHTPHKFYLDADPRIRAERRARELHLPLAGPEFETLVQEISDRDHSDRSRQLAPLTLAPGAQVIDTSRLSIEEFLQAIKTALGR